ncbi:MAG: TetR/AcrR family transcriptional regulator [Sphingomonadales bacterium]|nr:TetR/AcrR family transcriptional regulator [Sphingomonadales bacterium]
MAPTGKHRQSILAAAAGLFRRQGYAGTGLSEILEASGAPKGSLYHYFPGGKAEIGAHAVTFAGGLVTGSLEALAKEHQAPGDLLRAYAAQLADWMAQSAWQAGCPIATVLLETAPGEATITAAGAETLAGWSAVFARSLVAAGVPPERAQRLAGTTIAAMEGALLLARVQQSADPILTTADEIARLLEAAIEEA